MILAFTPRCLRASCTRAWIRLIGYSASSTFTRNLLILMRSKEISLYLASVLRAFRTTMINSSRDPIIRMGSRESLSNFEDSCACVGFGDLGFCFSITDSRRLASACSILDTKGTNWAFAETMNFLVASSIHARRTIRPYLLILRRGLRHIGQFFSSEVENGSELDFSAIIESSVSASSEIV